MSNKDTSNAQNRVTKNMIDHLEENIDKFEEELPVLSNFILPGGSHAASLIHFARTVTRRSETSVVSLSEKEQINKACLTYLNRLSDLLFVIARVLNKRSGTHDIIWKSQKDTL